MTPSSAKPKIGLLAHSLELYETLAPDLRTQREDWVRRDILPTLAPIAEVLFDRAVFRTEDIERMVGQFEAEGADALVVLLLAYSPSQVSLPVLQRTRLPILIWNTQELYGVDSSFGLADLFANHGAMAHRTWPTSFCAAACRSFLAVR